LSMAGENEATTRKTRIDRALLASGWQRIEPFKENALVGTVAVEEFPTNAGPADYVLLHDGEPLAVVEGKKVSLAPQNVISQAERYARAFPTDRRYGEFGVPFVYSTNGEVFWFRDLRREGSRSRQVSSFHTPQALREMLSHDTASAECWLRTPQPEHKWLRPYQVEAVKAVEDAMLRGKRKMLVAMATGTGKTVTVIELMHRLLSSGYARRILFLVDRRALAAQALSAMASFETLNGLKFDRVFEVYGQRFKREDVEGEAFDSHVLPNEYLTEPKPGISFVYVSTIQRMRINLFGLENSSPTSGDEDAELDADHIDIPINAFDVIIADESHRGYTTDEESKWREVLDHFDAVKVGLTATPALHTKAYFEEIVFRYEYERAVREGYLVDYDPIVIESNIRMNGVFLKEGEEVSVVDIETGLVRTDFLEDERQFDTAAIERRITVPDSNRKIVKEFLKHAREFQKRRGHFPKTIVFASNDLAHKSHADQLVNILRDECGEGDDFVTKITGSPTVDRPLQRIREFRNRKKPAIAVTVDMLTTGVDVPAVEALLFVRPVKSRILFEQMLGRGTRKCQDIHKTHFMVFDAVGILDYFQGASAFTAEPPSKPTRPIEEVIGEIYNNRDVDYNVKVLVRRLQRADKSVSGEGRQQFAEFVPDGDVQSFASSLPDLIKHERPKTIELLRNKRFQWLMENYPRTKEPFFQAVEQEDEVRSVMLFKTREGRELKPDDYIREFEEFVRSNQEHIDALSILLNRPKDFDTAALRQLRDILKAQEEEFTEENLRKAYNAELSDIISIVRHAAMNEPLGATKERVQRAMDRIRASDEFTDEQLKWLSFIEDHLTRNLLIEREHFFTPPFSRYGAWKKADAVFDGKLDDLLRTINAAVVQ